MSRLSSFVLVAFAVVSLCVPASAGITMGPWQPPKFLFPNIVTQSVSVYEHGDVIAVPYLVVTLKNTGMGNAGTFNLFHYTTIDGAVAGWPDKTVIGGIQAGQTKTVYIQLPYQPLNTIQKYSTLILPNYDKKIYESSMADNWLTGVFYK